MTERLQSTEKTHTGVTVKIYSLKRDLLYYIRI